jgi:hypothetical protein
MSQSGTYFHAHGDAAHCLLSGRKRWLMYSPIDWEDMWEALPELAKKQLWQRDEWGQEVQCVAIGSSAAHDESNE